jgi:hypothetical protein
VPMRRVFIEEAESAPLRLGPGPSTVMTRKRRRHEAFEEPEFEADPVQTEEEIAKAREEKEQEIWDAVREAHYEGQLGANPLITQIIHRQFCSH